MNSKKLNVEKAPPKGNIRFSLTLSEEQKQAKRDAMKEQKQNAKQQMKHNRKGKQ